MGFGRKDQAVTNYRVIPEGDHAARITDYEKGVSRFNKDQETVTLTWKVVDPGGDYHGEELKQFCNLDLNALDERSVIHAYAGLTGQLPPPGKEWASADEFLDELVGLKGTVTIKHKEKQGTNQQGQPVLRTYANVVAVSPLGRKPAAVAAVAADDEEPPF